MATQQEQQSETAESLQNLEANARGVTPRAFFLGLSLALAMCAVMPYNDYYVGATFLSGNFFPIGAIGAVLALVLAVNPFLIAIGQRASLFRPGEIIMVWAMIAVVAGIPSSGLMRYLIPNLVAPTYYKSPVNGWDALIVSHLPARLFVTDPHAVKTFYEGLHRGESVPWSAWAGPLAWWSLFVACLYVVLFCLSAIVRRQWVENERFAFPLVRLPVMLAETPESGQYFNSLVRSRLLWIGIGLVTALHTVKGLHLFYPMIPDISMTLHSGDYLHDKPWNGINDIAFNTYPLVVGFAYLLSSEVSASLWLFYLVFKLQQLLATIYVWDTSGAGTGWAYGPAWVSYQEVGGAVALIAWLLWSMRLHLKEVWRKAVTGAPEIDDAREPLSYRTAAFGLLAAYTGMSLWLVFIAGMHPALALGMVAGSLLVFLMLSYLVAQAGVLFMQQAYSPAQVTTMLTGSAFYDARSLAMASLIEHAGWQDARELMMPPLLNNYKAASETGLDARALTRALIPCVFLAVLVSGAASVWLPYTHGGATSLANQWGYNAAPNLSLSWTASLLKNPKAASVEGIAHLAGGALFVLTIFLCRASLPWFSLHPAGFLVALTYPMYTLWFSLFLGWLVKLPIMRYGGMNGFRAALPLFLGLILGDCANALVWTVVGLATHKGYLLLPN